MAVNLEVNVDPSKAEDGFKRVGDAAEQAADSSKAASERSGDAGVEALQEQLDKVEELQQAMSDLADEQVEGSESAREAAGEAGKSAEDAAAAAQVAKLRAGEAAKEISEGLSKAADAYTRTGDLTEATIEFADGAAKAVAQFHPIGGIVAMAVTNMAKFAKTTWDAAAAAKAAADEARRMRSTELAEGAATNKINESLAISEGVEAGYDAMQAKMDALQTTIRHLDDAMETLQQHQSQLAADDVAGREAAAKKYKELEEQRAALEKDFETARLARNLSYGKKKEELDKAEEDRQKRIRVAIEEATKATAIDLRSQDEKRQDLIDTINDGVSALREGKKSEEETATIIDKIRAAKRELLTIEQDITRQAEEQKRRAEDVQKEISRIQGMDVEEAKREAQTRGDLVKVMEDAKKKLQDQNLSQEEQNRLLREMEDAKRRIMAMDKKSAEDSKRAAEEARESAARAREEADANKRKWAENTKEGQVASVVASSPEAVAQRIARESGRRVGTVKQMMQRGDISMGEISDASQKNLDEAFKRQNSMSADIAQGQNNIIGQMQNNLAENTAQLEMIKAQTKAMLQAAQARADAARGRRHGS